MPDHSGQAIWFTIAFGLVRFAVNCAFALAVNRDATRLSHEGHDTVLVDRYVWDLAVVFGGARVLDHSPIRAGF
jgi:hypothetical protein